MKQKTFKCAIAMLLTVIMTLGCLILAFPAFADEELTETSANVNSGDMMEDPVVVPDDTPLDGNWCSDEENHWRADAVNQGIPTPHVDDDEDGICDVCQRVLSAEEPVDDPVVVPDDTPLDGNWCSDEENHWRADAVNQGIPTPHVDEDEDGICDVCQRALSAEEPVEEPSDEPGTGSENEETTVAPESNSDRSQSGGTSPKTGYKSDLALLTVMLLMSVGAITGVVVPLRKPGKQ